MQIEERYQRGLKLLKQMLGEKKAEETRKRWQRLAPDFERYVVEFLAGEIWSRSGLPLKIKSLCTISALAALGRVQGLELNIRMALKNGATREEIIETLLQIAPYAGFPAAWEGLQIAEKVFEIADLES
ncbi:MAG TPA: carboxymuconolactone decarboxylase family protein [Candidatus Binatia bacterium]|jgi:4-carboxymuconolactone decarboxylase|nr:carboxymuconolactone decarboxylase family protein [Candidatus Binatia bacterium]